MEVTNELVEKLGKLARLQIDPQQKEGLRQDMQQIIGFIEKLNEIDTTGVEPLMHMTSEINRFRADEIKSPITREQGLKNAFLKDNQFFLVPKVIKKQSS
ncbi:MAG: Asp-tRNA(Asn)/Glu-tRNA(Gln) amidotransferase subunit GatC [Chitinophagaceae bacterium]